MATLTQPIQIPGSTATTDAALASSLASSPGEFGGKEQQAVFISSVTSDDGSLHIPDDPTGHTFWKGAVPNRHPSGRPTQAAVTRAGYAALSQENGAPPEATSTESNTLYFKLNAETGVHQLVQVGNRRVEDLTKSDTPKNCCSPRRKKCLAITTCALGAVSALLYLFYWCANKNKNDSN